MNDPYSLEYRVKAALTHKFFEHLSWPGSSRGKNTLCIVGRDPFGQEIDALFQRRSKQRKVLRISVDAKRSELKRCSIAFISGWQHDAKNQVVDKLHRLGVLTVTERLSNGVILFYVRRGRVKFDINAKLAKKLGINVSPTLLQLSMAGLKKK